MNAQSIEVIENKENIVIGNKSRNSLSQQRNFGTDITKIVLPTIPINSPNPQLLDYYANDIYSYLYSIEHNYVAKFGYLKIQADITEKMRAILID